MEEENSHGSMDPVDSLKQWSAHYKAEPSQLNGFHTAMYQHQMYYEHILQLQQQQHLQHRQQQQQHQQQQHVQQHQHQQQQQQIQQHQHEQQQQQIQQHQHEQQQQHEQIQQHEQQQQQIQQHQHEQQQQQQQQQVQQQKRFCKEGDPSSPARLYQISDTEKAAPVLNSEYCDEVNKPTDKKLSNHSMATLLNEPKPPKCSVPKKTDSPYKKPPIKLEDYDPNVACPPCNCPGDNRDCAPAYCHLGYAQSLVLLRATLEQRYDLSGDALRIVEIIWTGKEAKSKDGCPVVQNVIQRTSMVEQVCVIARRRLGHYCEASVIVIILLAWEGVPIDTASDVYATLAATLPADGLPTQRQCDKNNSKTCVCQGSQETGGACYSFGCSWSMYFNGCKFAKSKNPKKFKLDEKSKTYDPKKEEQLELMMQALATDLAPLYKMLAPKSYNNQVCTQEQGLECRIGYGEERPFSGITACLDFSAHNHKDKHNLPSGVTMAVTLLKHKSQIGTDPYRDQIHALPNYVIAPGQDSHAMKYRPEFFSDINVPCPEPVPPSMFQHNTAQGVHFDEAGYIHCLRQQELDYKAKVAISTQNLGPPRHFQCGGIGMVPTHGSVILEHAIRELHVTTPLPRPYRYHPTRIALILYQHKNMNLRHHGYREIEEKMRLLKMGEKKGDKGEKKVKKENKKFERYDQGLPPLQDQIHAAQARQSREREFSCVIHPLHSTKHTNTQVSNTTQTYTESTSQAHMFTVGSYQHIQTSNSCARCTGLHTSTTQVKEVPIKEPKEKEKAQKGKVKGTSRRNKTSSDSRPLQLTRPTLQNQAGFSKIQYSAAQEDHAGFSRIEPSAAQEDHAGFSRIHQSAAQEDHAGFSRIQHSATQEDHAGFSRIQPSAALLDHAGFSRIQPSAAQEDHAEFSRIQPSAAQEAHAEFSRIQPSAAQEAHAGYSPIQHSASLLDHAGFSRIQPSAAQEDRAGYSRIQYSAAQEDHAGFSRIQPSAAQEDHAGFSRIQPSAAQEDHAEFSRIQPIAAQEDHAGYSRIQHSTAPNQTLTPEQHHEILKQQILYQQRLQSSNSMLEQSTTGYPAFPQNTEYPIYAHNIGHYQYR